MLCTFALFAALICPAHADSPAQNDTGIVPYIAADMSVPINLSTITAGTVLIAGVPGKTIYVLAYSFTLQNSTLQFGNGPAGSCGSPTPLTGTYAGLGGTSAVFDASMGLRQYFQSTPGGAICVTTTGTASAIGGVVSYTQF
jgi:hypothetical protein